MQTLDPVLVSSLSALYAAVLMVHAGLGKRLLSWRPQTVRRRWARRPRGYGRNGLPGGRR
jgi:hypothetical protein